MKAEPGERGPIEGKGSRYYPCRSNSFSGADLPVAGTPPLGLHPKTSMDGSPCPFRSSTIFECIRPEERRCATRLRCAARAMGLSAIYRRRCEEHQSGTL